MSNHPTVDIGPYASQIYKFTIYNEENFTDRKDIVKFLHLRMQGIKKNNTINRKIYKMLQSRTVAILAPSAEWVRSTAKSWVENSDLSKDMVVGIALLHKDDIYNKEVGRNQAVSNLKHVSLDVKEVKITDKHIYIDFKEYMGINLAVRLNKKTGFTTIIGHLSITDLL